MVFMKKAEQMGINVQSMYPWIVIQLVWQHNFAFPIKSQLLGPTMQLQRPL